MNLKMIQNLKMVIQNLNMMIQNLNMMKIKKAIFTLTVFKNDDSESEGADSESEDDEDQESNLHTDRSCRSEGDKSMDFSADQNKFEDSDPGLLSLLHHYCNILRETKLHHEQEILSYKQNINELQSKLNSKVQEVEDLTLKNSELRKKYQKLQIEKNECINKISKEFAAQKKCQLFLESGAIEEINVLKLQVRHLEKEKSNFERENSFLKVILFSMLLFI
ncbi:hypothetical protein AVEN_129331-1 [Araneus ventricosus]|uniref:Uncharacterized protein n=2 Tax=Araneus ventricosus TaxID=182803 RepID=A0A4Y2QJW1_ARAVE|nr:hypothetical protein AVEN_129331-1 [Araneus ventricosus]